MFIIFGIKGYTTLLGVVTLVCSSCHHPAAQRIEKWTRKFTLFFVPLFPVSTKRVLQCAMCGARSELSGEQAERLVASVQGPPPQFPTPQPPAGPGAALGVDPSKRQLPPV